MSAAVQTEFLVVGRANMPDEEEQYRAYRRVVEAFDGHPVIVRTFDIGGDKFATVFQMPSEMNPALGLRAVRLGLARPEIFMTQLRAMIRATAHGKLRIMLPMIASLGELFAVKELYDQAVKDVDARGLPRAEHISIGIMVEVPSAAVLAPLGARDDISQRLDRARLQERLPMNAARRHRECRRHGEDVHARDAEPMKQRREAQVVTDDHAEPAELRRRGRDSRPR